MPNMFYIPKTKKKGNTYTTKINRWESPSTIDRVNKKLGRLANLGQAHGLHHDKYKIQLSVPAENAIYTINLDEDGYIKNITRF